MLETKMETKFQEFKDEFRGDLQALLGQYFGLPANRTMEKGKVVLEALPGFPPKYAGVANAPTGPSVIPSVDVSSVHLRNHSPVIRASEKPS